MESADAETGANASIELGKKAVDHVVGLLVGLHHDRNLADYTPNASTYFSNERRLASARWAVDHDDPLGSCRVRDPG
jgi:hypothetical protein